MPWQEVSIMDQRVEFVALMRAAGGNRSDLCRRFGVSSQTGDKWLGRAAQGSEDWSAVRSRRPHESPRRSEAAVLRMLDRHPFWGARKIRRRLEDEGLMMPAASTVHAILVRHGRIIPPVRAAAHCRFEHPAPNLLWQMDFKGRFALPDRRWCHPLTIVDDHSRYALCLQACSNEQGTTVRDHLEQTFRRYGLPDAILVDNGSPWGDGPAQGWTKLGVWLLKLGVEILHSRPYHPQTRGKNERFHRTLKGRGAGDGNPPQLCRGAGRLRPLALDLQPQAPTPGPRPRGAGQPLSPEPAIDAQQAARARVPDGRRPANRRRHQGLHQLPRPVSARA